MEDNAMTALGDMLIRSAGEARAIARGEIPAARVYIPDEIDVRALREQLKMSQTAFARTFGIPVGTLRDWEQGRSRPEGVARAYLLVIKRKPEAVEAALRAA
jgi:putative transcriptional regulator